MSRETLVRLRRQYPLHANRDDSALLKSYPYQAAAILNQMLGQLQDFLLIDDRRQFPDDPLEYRVPRVLSWLRSLPSRAGKPAGSDKLRMVVIDAAYREALSTLPYRRGEISRGVRYFPNEVRTLFGVVTSADMKRLCRMTRSELAREYVSRTVEPRLSPERIRQLLPAARRLARELETIPPST